MVVKPSLELSHLRIDPFCPLRLNVPLLDPEHIDVPPLTLPPAVVLDTVIVMVLELAVGVPPMHVELDVSVQEIWSPVQSPASEKVVLFVPTLLPFFFHGYEGLDPPPVIPVTVKFTVVPWHTVEDEADIVMVGVSGTNSPTSYAEFTAVMLLTVMLVLVGDEELTLLHELPSYD